MEEDKRGTIEIELTDEEFLHVAKLAHENDITFNKMVERILIDFMENHKEKE
jgi:hypothetical protein